MPKMLRDSRDGSLYPMNPELCRHEAMETVVVDADGKVQGEPAPQPKKAPPQPELSEAAASDEVETDTKPAKKSSAKRTKQDAE